MLNFNKELNLKIGIFIISALFLLTPVAFSCPLKDSLRVPMNQSAERIKDVVLAAEGKAVIHEGEKEKIVTTTKGLIGLGKREIETGAYRLTGSPGINDVIRELRDAKEYRDLNDADLGAICNALRELAEGQYSWLADSLSKKKVSVYNIENGEFVEGITTHAGIRTQNIHITEQEYERLQALGVIHLAARLAHEVTEIDEWLGVAKELVKRKEIPAIGTVQEKYNDAWKNGIRKWIRGNIEKAKKEDERIHAEGLTLEMEILAKHLVNTEQAKGGGLKYADYIGKEQLLEAENPFTVTPPNGADHSLIVHLMHFRDRVYRKLFIKMVIANNKDFLFVSETAQRQACEIKRLVIDEHGSVTDIILSINGGFLEINREDLERNYEFANRNRNYTLQDVLEWWLNYRSMSTGPTNIERLIQNMKLLEAGLKRVGFITASQKSVIKSLIDGHATFLKIYKSPSRFGSSKTFFIDSPELRSAIDSLQLVLDSKEVIDIPRNLPKDSNDVVIAARNPLDYLRGMGTDI